MFDKRLFMMDGFGEEGNVIPVFSMNDDELKFDDEYKLTMPILALKNTVLFPGVVIPITVGRDKSIRALQKAEKGDKFLGVLTQKDVESEDPTPDGLHKTGTIARIMKILRMPDGSTTAILQGRKRFRAGEFVHNNRMLEAEVHVIQDKTPVKNLEFNAIISTIRDYARQIIELSPNIPTEANLMLQNIKNDTFLLNFIASNMNLDVSKKQEILETDDPLAKATLVMTAMNSELQLLQIKDEIETKVRGDLEKQQKEYFLNQQLKTIQEEPGRGIEQTSATRRHERLAGRGRSSFRKGNHKSQKNQSTDRRIFSHPELPGIDARTSVE